MTTAILSPRNVKVKFRLAGGAQPLILLPVQVNGDGPFEFILDTGAGTSLLSSDLAKKLKIKIISTKEGQSAGGKISVSLAKVDSLAVGQAKLDDVDVGIVDLTHIGNTIGTKIDGDIGYNFLKHFRITIDYHDCEIRLDEPRRIQRLGRSSKAEVPMRLASLAKPLLLVDVHANGHGPFQFAIDTGTSTTAIWRGSLVSKARPSVRSRLAARRSMLPPAPWNRSRLVAPESTTSSSSSPISSGRSVRPSGQSWMALSAITSCETSGS